MKGVLFGIVLGLSSPVFGADKVPTVEDIVCEENKVVSSSLENLRNYYLNFVENKLYGVETQFENFKKFGATWDKEGISIYVGFNGNDGLSVQDASFRYVLKF